VPGVRLEKVTLALLAGGEGSRMGTPKALLRVGDKPVLRFLLERLNWPGPTLLVSSPQLQHPPGAEAFDRETSDEVAGEGPLRGLAAALRYSKTDMLVVIAVDMVLVERNDLEWFVGQLDALPAALGLMSAHDGKVEPLPLAIRKTAIDVVNEHLKSGRRSLHGLTDDARIETTDGSSLPPRVWFNVNTPGDWEQFLSTLAH
jgi:molybdopterin-guanine dinucleotide biosynthesis protein A